jgi:pimeloyl-ACP methyl ester carboxylesterase
VTAGDRREPESLLVTVDTGERIHFLDWGRPARGPGAPLLLLHGLYATGWAWAPVARRLADEAHVLAPDLRGHGLSESPRTGYDLESLAFDVLTVLSAAGYGEVVGRPAVLAGHGLGALVAATAARLEPGSVSAVALLDAGWEDLAEATGESPAEFLRTIADPPEVLRSLDAYLADRRDYDPGTWDADQERAARAAVDEKHAGHVVPVVRDHALGAAVAAMWDYRPHEALAAIAAPLLVLVAESGAADDEGARERRLALEDALRVRADAGGSEARVLRLAGAGHNLMRYRADEVASELRALLPERSP